MQLFIALSFAWLLSRAAVVTAPLFSFGASGKLADALVYFPYKGLDVVRSYVVPANPNTAAQQTQRARLTGAVTEWHDAGYTDDDKTAWKKLASTLGGALSGFNAMVRGFIATQVAGQAWPRLADVTITPVSSTAVTVNVTTSSTGVVPDVNWGTSPTFMPTAFAMTDNTGDDWQGDLTGLPADAKIYFFVDRGPSDLSADYSRTGIYETQLA